ncbi:MAG: D-ribose pyranase [Pleomorphochaeta sp.]
MKKDGIQNIALLNAISRMGHGDMILIGDVGCPFPRHDMTTCVDLAVTKDIPKVEDVLKAVLDELVVESYIVSEETKSVNPGHYETFTNIIKNYDNKGNALSEKTIAHDEMKDLWLNGALNGKEVKTFVRTGEQSPFSYIVLVAGVNF